MKKYTLCYLLLVCFLSFGQQLNQYKYAQVPSKFSFLNSKDEFRLNTLTKMYMEKYNFVTYFDTDALPDDFVKDNCNKVFVDIVTSNTIFMTKLKIVLKDCKNNMLFTSQEGKSREKQYAVAYNQALREAFESFKSLNHIYSESVPQYKVVTPIQISEDKVPVVATKEITKADIINNDASKYSILELKNGKALLDSTQKIVMYLYVSNLANVYHADKLGKKGICFKVNNDWFFEYYENETLISEKLEIKL